MPKLRKSLSIVGVAFLSATGIATVGTVTETATKAEAVQLYSVYTPDNHSTYVQGWANINTSCPYYQCQVYLKIERSSYSGWRYLNGNWVNWRNSWVSMTAGKLRGCYNYRTTIEIYEWSIGPIGGGVNIGPVGVNASGQTIYDYKFGPWSSGYRRVCY
ncbi:MAG TPA: hypothetical protein VLE72_03510 [Candidatus Saccharimonadales bacterium]|nr:hypothetical protein [Candidatus Saccharimonadales bacterium]